jgi:hypothetical protein
LTLKTADNDEFRFLVVLFLIELKGFDQRQDLVRAAEAAGGDEKVLVREIT